MLINFKEDMSFEERLQILLAYYQVPPTLVVADEDIPMLVMALNQDDVASIQVNEEGGINIDYYGDDWQNPIVFREEE